jgi:hypothetical protein
MDYVMFVYIYGLARNRRPVVTLSHKTIVMISLSAVTMHFSRCHLAAPRRHQTQKDRAF